MLKTIFISLSKASWAQRMITGWGFAWRAASRFVAGETIPEAIRVVRQLNERGINTTLDFLGEDTRNTEEAKHSSEEVIHLLEEIEAQGLHSNVSVKLTQIGLRLDESLCWENLEQILNTAREKNNFVRIDMEDSGVTTQTLEMYYRARRAGYENTGVVIQSYLYRSEKDIRDVGELVTRVRLCKGAYKEPKEVAFPSKKEVDEKFDHLVDLLIAQDVAAGSPEINASGRFPAIPGIATHDSRRIDYAKGAIRKAGLPSKAVEFQMLYGIRRDLQQELVKEGYPVRVYVPYGTRWYPYFMRRLAERPANIWFFVSNFFRH